MNGGHESGIVARLAEVRARVAAAAARAGTDASAVTIVGVTKGVEPGLIEAAVSAGLTEVGENRIQEWLSKAPAVGLPVNWHFVGRLQTNKVRYLRRGVQVLHSLDRESLLQALTDCWRSWSAGLGRLDQPRPGLLAGLHGPICLVQVNIADEDTKSGLAPGEVEAFLELVARTGVVRLGGFMTIAPYVARAEDVRWVFARMREIRDAARERWPGLDLSHLSMGMSGDYEVAIEEGATIVRVGTAIFGPRD